MKRARTIPLWLGGLLHAALLFAPAAPALAFDDAKLARQAYATIILPGYAGFDGAAAEFAGKAEALCASPSAGALEQARAAARAALLALGRVDVLRFGPIVAKQRLERLLFTPDPHGIVRKQTSRLLARRDAADIAEEKLAGASVAVQGFGAVDVVLFGEGADALAGNGEEAAFRCRYLMALARNIAQLAAEVHAEWRDTYKRAWLQPGGADAAYLSAKETTQTLFRAYVTELEVIRTQRQPGLLADPSGGFAPLTLGRTALPFVVANIAGARALLGSGGFQAEDLAQSDGERAAIEIIGSVATDLTFALRAGETAAAKPADAGEDARQQLQLMQLSLKNAEETGRAALGQLTGQALGFNSLDGD